MNMRRIAKRVANRYLYAKDECSGIKDIHKYVKCRAEKLKEDGADEGAAFGTAWSIACKHKRDVLDPKNEVCTMPPSGYLKKKGGLGSSELTLSVGDFNIDFLKAYKGRKENQYFVKGRMSVIDNQFLQLGDEFIGAYEDFVCEVELRQRENRFARWKELVVNRKSIESVYTKQLAKRFGLDQSFYSKAYMKVQIAIERLVYDNRQNPGFD